jgi:hypothetical protein
MAFDGGAGGLGIIYVNNNATFNATVTVVNQITLEFNGTGTSVLVCPHTTLLNTLTSNKASGTLSIATNNVVCNNFYNLGATTTLTTNLTCNYFYLNGGTFNINAAVLTANITFTDDDSATSRSIVTTTGTLNVGTGITTTSLTAVTYYLNNTATTFTAGTGNVVIGSTTAQATNTTFYHGCTGNLRDVLFQGTKTFISGGSFGVSLTVAGSTTAGFRVTTPAAINHELTIDTRISITVTGGTFSVVGNSVTNRALLQGDQMGTANSIVLTGTATQTLTNVDLQDISFTYGSALTGTSIGNCGGNTNVTPTTAVTCYAKTGASAFNYNGAMWFTASGGSTTQRVPLPQDTVIFDSNTGSGVVTVNARTLGGAITTTGWTGSFSINLLSDCIPSIYGQYTGTGSLLNPITRVKFGARADTTIPANGITGTIFIDCTGYTATLAGAINSADAILWLHSGYLNTSASGYAITASNLKLDGSYSGYTGSRSGGGNLTLNSSTVTLTARTSSVVIDVPTVYVTLTPNTSTINISPTGSFSSLSITGGTFSTVTLTPNSSMTSFTKTGSSTFTSFSCSTGYPFTFFFENSSTNTFTSLSLIGTTSAPIVVRPVTLTSSGTATLAIASASITRYTAFRQITKSGASTLRAYNVSDLGGNTSITFAATTRAYAFTSGSGSFTVPTTYNNSNMFYVVGGGGGAHKRNATASGSGGGGGATGITSNLSLTKGQTVYYSVGAGGTGATVNNTAGGTGGTSWVNTSANTTPASAGIGAIAVGGTGTLSATGAGGAANTTVNTIGVAGGNAGSNSTVNASGGGTAVGYAYLIARTGGAGASSAGGGGAGIAANGGASPGTAGGVGGAGVGSGGTGGTNGTTLGGAGGTGGVSAGGGGGGSVSSTSATAGAGGAGGDGTDFSYIYLNGSSATGSVGPGGAGGGGGGYVTTSTGVTGGAGGAGSYGAGGGGSGRGGTVNGNGGNGGGGLVIFVYDLAVVGNQGFVIG